MVVNKKEQLFGKNQVSPRRPDYSGRLQKNIDIFFQQRQDQLSNSKKRQSTSTKVRSKAIDEDERLIKESAKVVSHLDP